MVRGEGAFVKAALSRQARTTIVFLPRGLSTQQNGYRKKKQCEGTQ